MRSGRRAARPVRGRRARCRGRHGRRGGVETTTPCDTVVLGLGRAPRDVLARMAGEMSVTVVGPAAQDHALPPAPTEGVVCPCSGTTVDDLEAPHGTRGSRELELLKRASLAGSGRARAAPACRTSAHGSPSGRGTVPEPFTARPAARQITLAEAAADTTIDAFRRTPLHDEHLALGGRMDRFGGWWRPWHYGDARRGVLGRSRGRLARRRQHARQARRLRPGRRRVPRAALSRATSRTSSPAARATRCCSTSAATSWTTG